MLHRLLTIPVSHDSLQSPCTVVYVARCKLLKDGRNLESSNNNSTGITAVAPMKVAKWDTKDCFSSSASKADTVVSCGCSFRRWILAMACFEKVNTVVGVCACCK